MGFYLPSAYRTSLLKSYCFFIAEFPLLGVFVVLYQYSFFFPH